MNKKILILLLIVFLVLFTSFPAYSGKSGLGEALAFACLIYFIIFVGIIVIQVVLLFVFCRVHLKAKEDKKYVLLGIMIDSIVILYFSFALFYITRTFSDFRSYQCGYGGILWELFFYGYNIFYTPAIICLFFLIILIIVGSNIWTIKLSSIKRTLIHLVIFMIIGLGVPTLFQPANAKKLFVNDYRLIKYMVNEDVKTLCKYKFLLEPYDCSFYEAMTVDDPVALSKSLGRLKSQQKAETVTLLTKLSKDEDPRIRMRAQMVLDYMK